MALLVTVSLVAASCGSRLSGQSLSVAEGAGHAGDAASVSGSSTPATAAPGAGSTPVSSVPGAAGSVAAGSLGTGSANPASPATTAAAAANAPGAPAAAGATTAGFGPNCSAAANGGATDVGVTANSINVANIASIGGVAPGLTQTARQATQALVAYANSQGGVCGRALKLQVFDDQSDAGQNNADATQACQSDFALVGSASGFDNGGAGAVQSCGIPYVGAELSTHELSNLPNTFAGAPGNGHYYPTGPALYLKSKYPNAVTHAAMIYLNLPVTADGAMAEMHANQSVGFNYIYVASASVTEANYAPFVEKMRAAGVQYVTEFSDDNSAARLSQAMAQANFHPQVIDWFSEEYSQNFIQESQGAADGNLVLMATMPYEDAASNPGMQLYLSWLNRVAPGAKHDIFGQLAWSGGLAFLQAARAVGGHLTRAAVIAQLHNIHRWDGGGVTFPVNDFGAKIPSPCFTYFKITGNAFSRVYPAAPNSLDCSGGLFHS
jgi:ABC-type branched-subunit amino acid transport system substrate-binding protein